MTLNGTGNHREHVFPCFFSDYSLSTQPVEENRQPGRVKRDVNRLSDACKNLLQFNKTPSCRVQGNYAPISCGCGDSRVRSNA
jgi:hypothetical protein